jgi:hypothetical protein
LINKKKKTNPISIKKKKKNKEKEKEKKKRKVKKNQSNPYSGDFSDLLLFFSQTKDCRQFHHRHSRAH